MISEKVRLTSKEEIEMIEVKKAAKSAAYKKFVSRGGGKNPGSKVVPDTIPCMAG